ncbi:MAG: spondin domain-containing protein [Gammaproteobacteria bacterium]|nr:spondin domain-containing protein [Gammaproteobacteria bacterium]MBU2180367.1 spondin domain-containing protein [Gammaproteobacteria bacterium]MBU2222463.1 spondin domain-containing protein [Gammaproteobacteria bacterium]MBU2277296.1 spondin domain-containing protein [Gammaproteobacteria bacterium]MBU2428367.1 spondin domain-containing protein [Gammaproteobacteria bacterium]
MLKKTLCLTTLLLANVAVAADLEIKVTNLTYGLHFTPLLVAAHPADSRLFQAGSTATPALQKMAEGGDIAELTSIISAVAGNSLVNPANGLLAPGAEVSAMLTTTGSNNYLSVTAMLLPTNDGFVGLNSWPIPTEKGTYTVMLNAYDAGTEANNELVVEGSGAPNIPGIPAAPGGNAGSGGTGVTLEELNTTVHIHRGSLGDDNLSGGKSDLDNRVHRWLNPVARLTVTVK